MWKLRIFNSEFASLSFEKGNIKKSTHGFNMNEENAHRSRQCTATGRRFWLNPSNSPWWFSWAFNQTFGSVWWWRWCWSSCVGEEEERFGTALLVEGRFLQYIFGEDITHDKQKHRKFQFTCIPFSAKL